MTTEELLDYTRGLLRDTKKPYLWSDSLIEWVLNEGQEEYVSATHMLLCADEALALSPGEDTYMLPDNITFIYRVRFDGYDGHLAASTDAWTPVDAATGRSVRYTLDTAARSIRFWPAPDISYTAIMRVNKTPDVFDLCDGGAESPLPRAALFAIADWAAYRCFTQNDADGLNVDAAERAKKRFYDAVRSKKLELSRFKVGSATRVGGNKIA
jgi:hypothetical protein